MLRIFSLVVLTAFTVPSSAAHTPAGETVVAQDKQAPQQTPRRDCERNRDEGVGT